MNSSRHHLFPATEARLFRGLRHAIAWCALLPLSVSFCQAQYLPLASNRGFYEFLERMEIRGNTGTSTLIFPLTRRDAARTLMEIRRVSGNLTTVESRELFWYEEEFAGEIRTLMDEKTTRPVDATSRWRLFSHEDSLFAVRVSPILGVAGEVRGGELQLHRWNGLDVSASYGGQWGMRMDFRDNWEQGNALDKSGQYSAATGYSILAVSGNTIQYNTTQGSITYETDHLMVGAGKEAMTWGSGYRSQLILSEKAPSFPALYLDLHPVEWLRLHYVHGWLNSRVPDSAASYVITYHPTDTSYASRLRQIDHPKYYAAHILELIPSRDLRISIGESIIYSDTDPYPGFLIPVLFFRLVDHYEEGGNGARGSNAQFFLDLHYRFLNRFSAYATLFLDEFSLTNVLSGDNSRNQLGFTIGGAAYSLFPNLLLRAEYTRILPWVYSNKFPTQTYANSGYLLGHYIGQNADQLFAQADYRFLRGFEVKLWGELIRRGGLDDVYYQNSPVDRPFLYGAVRTDKAVGLEASYELLHEFFARAWYRYGSISDEDPLRTPSADLGKQHAFGASLHYGL